MSNAVKNFPSRLIKTLLAQGDVAYFNYIFGYSAHNIQILISSVLVHIFHQINSTCFLKPLLETERVKQCLDFRLKPLTIVFV